MCICVWLDNGENVFHVYLCVFRQRENVFHVYMCVFRQR